jgi:hypothetical protein
MDFTDKARNGFRKAQAKIQVHGAVMRWNFFVLPRRVSTWRGNALQIVREPSHIPLFMYSHIMMNMQVFFAVVV